MRIDELQQLSAWLVATDITVLELSGPGEHLRLRREEARVGIFDLVEDDAARPPRDATPAAASRPVARAGSVGIFLHHHPMREAPLAPPGASIRTGQTVGLLQIGQLLLPVAATGDGAVTGMLAGHGVAVGFGTPLVEFQSDFEAT